MIQLLSTNKRMLLAILVTAIIGANFWLGSRYPSLNEKAYMGGEMQFDALGFDVVIEVAKDDPVYFKIAATTVNWIKTNKTGMIFGIMIAACIMTLLSLFKRRSFVGSFANTVMGALVGTPLGVCVNCAAPIARGMHSAGARLETTLAMMLSSPTMNVIVLTMLFSLFPWYMAVTKIAVTLAFILVGIPLLSRYVFKDEVVASTNSAQVVKQTATPFQWSLYEEEAPEEGESWAMGGFRQLNDASKNLILLNDGQRFEGILLKELVGETLSTLLSDFNNDGIMDLFIGNDFSSPDYFYLGTGKGSLKQIRRDDQLIPHTTTTTMTVHVADIDNDLVPEMYIGEIARGAGVKFFDYMRDSSIVCEEFEDAQEKRACQITISDYAKVAASMRRRDVARCLELANPKGRPECVGINVLWTLVQARRQKGAIDPESCQVLPDHMRMFRYMCGELAKPPIKSPRALYELAIPQIDKHNVLLVANSFGGFEDQAIERGLELGGWSWNAKFADVDNDGWKDIYIANGFFQSDKWETNLFYRNGQDGKFTEKTEEFGLEDFRVTVSYVYVDFDNDGDLDIISVPVHDNIRVFENKGNGNNSIAFELRDYKGNRYGIGSKVIIRYGDAGEKHQVWEIQSGGGFLSFDPAITHFGLGAYNSVSEVEIQWSTGEKTILEGPFEAGARYLLTRRK